MSYKIRKQLALTGNEFESLVIEFDKNVFSSKKNIIVGIFYRATTSSLKLFNQKLETTLDIIQREKKYSYIMGDFNVHCIEAGTCPGGGGALEIEKQKKRSSEQILSYFTYILLLF